MKPYVVRCQALAIAILLCTHTSADDFASATRPFLRSYCVQCHGPETQKSDLRLDTLDIDVVNGSGTDMWQEVLDRINLGDMPPDEAKQPKAKERKRFVALLTMQLRKASQSSQLTGGRNIMRRLTAYEYSNTLRDLLDLDLHYAVDLPPEGSAEEGFKNNSMVLGTSALHIEYFERIARAALERIILVAQQAPQPYSVRVEPELAFKTPTPTGNSKNQRKRRGKSGTSYTIKKGEHYQPGNGARRGWNVAETVV